MPRDVDYISSTDCDSTPYKIDQRLKQIAGRMLGGEDLMAEYDALLSVRRDGLLGRKIR